MTGHGRRPPTRYHGCHADSPRRRFAFGSVAAVGLFGLLTGGVAASAQDTVTIAVGDAGGQQRLSGQVVDYTGKALVLQTAGGRQQSIPGERVLDVQTQYGPRHQEADAAMAAGRFAEALALYQKAIDDEPRTWVRRRIIAQWVWCYRALGRPVEAGENFLLLLRSDPDTPYFDCIPLSWLSRQTPAAVEQAAMGWMQRQEPAAVLLGASQLLTGSQRSTALARLRQLAASADKRVAQLALAQSWRASAFSADQPQIDGWSRVLATIPEPLAAGPYYVVGSARRQHDQWQQAAIDLMRVAILYPQQRELAAQSLIDAGRCLEKLEQPRQAASLYHELIENYPEQARPVAEAESRLEALQERP